MEYWIVVDSHGELRFFSSEEKARGFCLFTDGPQWKIQGPFSTPASESK